MKKSKRPVVNKIDFDENTAEPVIVEVPDKDVCNQLERDEQLKIKNADFFEQHKDQKSLGKQIVMKHLGITALKAEDDNKALKIVKRIISTLFILFVVGVLAFTIYNDFYVRNNEFLPWSEIFDIFSIGWLYLLGAILALALCYFFKAIKLSIFCKPLTGKFHFKTCFETAIIGHYYNFVTPLAAGGQAFEMNHLSKHGIKDGVSHSLPLTTYVLNQFAFIVLCIVALVMFENNTLGTSDTLYNAFPPTFKVLAYIGIILCAIMPALVIVFSLTPRLGVKIVKLVICIASKIKLIKKPKETTYKITKTLIKNSHCVKKTFQKPLLALLSLFISVLEHVAYLSIAYFTLKIFNFNSHMVEYNPLLEWLQIIQLVLLLNCSVSFIPTPGNSGAADLSFYLLFASGLAGGLAFPAMTIWRVLAFYSYIIIGFVFATLKKRSDRKKEKANFAEME